MNTKTFNVVDALISLCPGANWTMESFDFDTLNWFENNTYSKPEKKQVEDEIVRLQLAYNATQYQRQRAAKYPPITDYIDGVVKGDQAQIDKYIADCLAVKAMYPKPQE
jgi:hypothetical protein